MNYTDAKVLKKSISPDGEILSTFQLIAPQICQNQLIRHRVFSLSILSKRAIGKQRVANDKLFLPTDVRYNQSGMSGDKQLTEEDYNIFKEWYLNLEQRTLASLNELQIDIHKQTINRLVEQFRYFGCILTSTSKGLDNFFSLRIAKDSQPEIFDLAVKMKTAYDEAPFQNLNWGEWHIPFESDADTLENKIKVATTRAARTSYGLYENSRKMTTDEEIVFANTLVENKHMSPLEHCAMAMPRIKLFSDGKIFRNIFRNFDGFMQYRSFEENGLSVYLSPEEIYYTLIKKDNEMADMVEIGNIWLKELQEIDTTIVGDDVFKAILRNRYSGSTANEQISKEKSYTRKCKQP